ncbi:phage late control D family protein [Lysobacter arvi]|uniref:Phage late control D family protein n=1 Tax=Lysobacter arvi TaxID=3038776 RepID=A0ABU1CE36_9GAMM|nr:phage late control D family protein [Lysobacter arvi]MDR0182420.1 phage late control D family protein [Lysobacter arvi]
MSQAPYPIPAFRVTLDGQDLTDRIAPRLIDLTLTENRAGEADQLDLRIHDHDGRMALPRRGVTIAVALGWKGGEMVDKGTFKVDEVEHSGPPDIITIRARSADLTAELRNRRERSWDSTTLGAILTTIAGEHGLTPRIAPALADRAIDHLDQTESDAALLTRLAKQYDAVSTIKAGHLVFAPIGSGTTTGGEPLPEVVIHRRDGDTHTYRTASRDEYSGVRSYWHHKAGATRKSVLVGDSGNAKRLPNTFASETEARQAAHSEWERLYRGAATLSVSLAMGHPEIYPEQSARLAGFADEISDRKWLIAKATHSLTDRGLTTALDMEGAQ